MDACGHNEDTFVCPGMIPIFEPLRPQTGLLGIIYNYKIALDISCSVSPTKHNQNSTKNLPSVAVLPSKRSVDKPTEGTTDETHCRRLYMGVRTR